MVCTSSFFVEDRASGTQAFTEFYRVVMPVVDAIKNKINSFHFVVHKWVPVLLHYLDYTTTKYYHHSSIVHLVVCYEGFDSCRRCFKFLLQVLLQKFDGLGGDFLKFL